LSFLPKTDIEEFGFAVSKQCSDVQKMLVQKRPERTAGKGIHFLPTPSETKVDIMTGLNPHANIFVPSSDFSDKQLMRRLILT